MRRSRLDAGDGAGQVVERAATTGTADVLGAGGAQAGGLEDGESRIVDDGVGQLLLAGRGGGKEEDAVGQSVEEQGTHVGGCVELEVLAVGRAELIVLEEDDGVGQALVPHLMHQGAQFAGAVGVARLGQYDHLGMAAQASFHLLAQACIREKQEFQGGGRGGDGHEHLGSIGRERVLLALPRHSVDNVAGIGDAAVGRRELRATVDVVGTQGAHGIAAIEPGRDDNGHMGAPDIGYGTRGTAHGTQIVEGGTRLSGNERMTRAGAGHVGGQFVGNGDFALGLLAQRYAQGVADAVAKQGTDAQRALDAAVLALAGLGHAEVQGEVHALALHHVAKQAHGAHHDDGVAGLDAHDHVAEFLPLTDAQELHAALHDALGRVAVARHDAIRQGTVVHADAERCAVLAADGQQALEAFLQALQLGGILLVRVVQLLEGPRGVDVIARVDADFFDNGGGHVGHIGIEVDVGYERRGMAPPAEFGTYVFQIFCLDCALCREAHQVAAGADNSLGLVDAAVGVGGGTGRHALQAQGVVTSDVAALDMGHVGAPWRIIKQVHRWGSLL